MREALDAAARGIGTREIGKTAAAKAAAAKKRKEKTRKKDIELQKFLERDSDERNQAKQVK